MGFLLEKGLWGRFSFDFKCAFSRPPALYFMPFEIRHVQMIKEERPARRVFIGNQLRLKCNIRFRVMQRRCNLMKCLKLSVRAGSEAPVSYFNL